MNPLVSVVIPVLNGQDYIAQAIESVYAQETPVEILVVDDASTDRTAEILAPYRNRGDFVYLKNEERSGAAFSRNRGVREAGGRYIAFLDADDWWEKGKLTEQLRRLEETGYVISSTGRTLVRPDGTPTGHYIPVKETVSYRELLKHNSINCSSVVLLREAALRFPMEHDDCHEDYLCWLRILREYGPCAGVNKPYLNYRLSAGGKSRNKFKSARMNFRVYRYMHYGPLKSLVLFFSYAAHGLWKYR